MPPDPWYTYSAPYIQGHISILLTYRLRHEFGHLTIPVKIISKNMFKTSKRGLFEGAEDWYVEVYEY